MSDQNHFTVTERVNSAITMVVEARGVPLSASCVIHRGEILDILEQAREALPADLDSAQQILVTRDAILEEAQTSADQLISHAREEVAQMVEQTQIVAAARKEAQRIMDEVDAEAKHQRDEIEAYIDSRLATLEVILNKTLDVVQRGRDKLQGADEKDILAELAE
jgi:vacuolar-type H+-ATPase subunit H